MQRLALRRFAVDVVRLSALIGHAFNKFIGFVIFQLIDRGDTPALFSTTALRKGPIGQKRISDVLQRRHTTARAKPTRFCMRHDNLPFCCASRLARAPKPTLTAHGHRR